MLEVLIVNAHMGMTKKTDGTGMRPAEPGIHVRAGHQAAKG